MTKDRNQVLVDALKEIKANGLPEISVSEPVFTSINGAINYWTDHTMKYHDRGMTIEEVQSLLVVILCRFRAVADYTSAPKKHELDLSVVNKSEFSKDNDDMEALSNKILEDSSAPKKSEEEIDKAVALMDRSTNALYLELPESIANDVKRIWNAVNEAYASQGAATFTLQDMIDAMKDAHYIAVWGNEEDKIGYHKRYFKETFNIDI